MRNQNRNLPREDILQPFFYYLYRSIEFVCHCQVPLYSSERPILTINPTAEQQATWK